MAEILRTQRLILREHCSADAEALHQINSDPQVMRLTRDQPSESVEAMREAITNYPDYATYGYGRWLVVYEMSSTR